MQTIYLFFPLYGVFLKKRDANHREKGDHSGARFDLCTVYGHIHQQFFPLFFCSLVMFFYVVLMKLGRILRLHRSSTFKNSMV